MCGVIGVSMVVRVLRLLRALLGEPLLGLLLLVSDVVIRGVRIVLCPFAAS